MINIEKLKDARDGFSFTQTYMSNLLGMTESGYNKFENEKDTFPIKKLVETCDALNVSLDYIFDFVDFENYFLSKPSYNIEKSSIRIKNLRKEKNITQEKLANILNVNRTIISKWERSRLLIATPFLYAICKKYHLSADYLLGKIDEPKYLK